MHTTRTPDSTGARRTPARRRVATSVLLGVALLVAAGCGDSDSESKTAASSTTEASTSASSSTSTSTSGPDTTLDPATSSVAARLLAGERGVTVTADERACLTPIADGPADDASNEATIACLEMDTLVAWDAAYLESETEATEEQIACIDKGWRALSITDARALVVDGGYGEKIYVPCGLPS